MRRFGLAGTMNTSVGRPSWRTVALVCVLTTCAWSLQASAARFYIVGSTQPGTNSYDIVFDWLTAEGVVGYAVSVHTTGTYTGNFTTTLPPGFTLALPMNNPPANGASGTVGSWGGYNLDPVAGGIAVIGTVEVTVAAGDIVYAFFTPVDGVVDEMGFPISAELNGLTITGVSPTTTTTLPPGGGDVAIDATKLVIVDKLLAADKAKVVFVAKDEVHGIAKGPGTDPGAISATVDIAYTGTAGEFALPSGALNGDDGWKANKDTVATYVNKGAPGGPTGAKVAVIKPGKLLKLVGKTLGDTPISLGAPPDGAGVDVVYTVVNGATTVRHCTNFAEEACGYKEIAGGSGRKLVCKGGTPVACP